LPRIVSAGWELGIHKLTHDWIGEDFMVSQLIEAIGFAFAITALITFGVANITPPQAAANRRHDPDRSAAGQ
jgi:hypothetical protein